MSAYSPLPLLPLPPYKRKIWDYKTAKTDLICAYLWSVNWQELFLNLNVSEKGLVFNFGYSGHIHFEQNYYLQW